VVYGAWADGDTPWAGCWDEDGHRVILDEFRPRARRKDQHDGRRPQHRRDRVPGQHLGSASPDLLREVVRTFAQAVMGADADAVCGAGYGERTE